MFLHRHLLFFAFSLLVSVDATSKDIYVSGNANLQQEINTAQAGDHLRLMDGRYTGNFIIDKPLTLSGSKNAILVHRREAK